MLHLLCTSLNLPRPTAPVLVVVRNEVDTETLAKLIVAVRNEVDTETLAKLIMERPPDLPTDLLIKKGSLIFLKLGTLKVHDKWMCGIFEFWWNNFLMGIKFDFKFEIWENFYKGFPCKKKKSMGILCKMSPNQNYREFFCIFFKQIRKKLFHGNSL